MRRLPEAASLLLRTGGFCYTESLLSYTRGPGLNQNCLRLLHGLLVLMLLSGCTVIEAPAPPAPGANPPEINQPLLLGNPSQARSADPNNYLMLRPTYALAYDRSRGTARWVSWHLALDDLGAAGRSEFASDPDLPGDWYRVASSDYTRSGYDRGHLLPSADRTASPEINQSVFYMTNIIPQAPDNNQGPWSDLEEYSRSLVRNGNELYTIAGVAGSLGALAGGQVTIPEYVWKVIVVLPAGSDDLARITASTEVIAVSMPNRQGIRGQVWRDFSVSVADIETMTGLDLLSALPQDVQVALQQGAGAPAINAPPLAPTPLPISGDCSELLFSEYIEGSGNNKALELYNPTPSAINLDGYQVAIYSNGAAQPSGSVDLHGTLEADTVYVITSSQADPALLERADTTSAVANFNGNDALVLFHSGQIIDSIGQVGVDPGTAWGAAPFSTQDYTLRRKFEVRGGRTQAGSPFDPATEWDAHPTDTFDGLFGHLNDCP